MTTNYDASVVGVPYVRFPSIHISYPEAPAMPSVVIERALAVKLADGSVRTLEVLAPINVSLDLLNDANDPVPLRNPEDGTALGMDTTLMNTMLSIYAIAVSKGI